MYKYVNAKTGAVIEVPTPISGGNWQEIKEAPKKPKKKTTED